MNERRRHDMGIHMQWCRRCGRPLEQIVEQGAAECDGLAGVVHARYVRAAREFAALVGTDVGEVL